MFEFNGAHYITHYELLYILDIYLINYPNIHPH